jgi:hypothetical protein
MAEVTQDENTTDYLFANLISISNYSKIELIVKSSGDISTVDGV